MTDERRFKTWQEIIEYRKMAKTALVPPSYEQVQEAVARKQKAFAEQRAREDAAWDIQYETLRQASKAKNN